MLRSVIRKTIQRHIYTPTSYLTYINMHTRGKKEDWEKSQNVYNSYLWVME